MELSDEERRLLLMVVRDEDGEIRTRARPSDLVQGLAKKKFIVNVLTTTLSPPGRVGGTSVWKITASGRALVESAKTYVDRPSADKDR